MQSKLVHFAFASVVFLAALLPLSTSVTVNPSVGVVEGFYWPQSDAVFGQYGGYSHAQRLQLLKLCADVGIGVYWYVPQNVATMASWTAAEKSEWTEVAALGASLGVRVVYGLRPGWIDANYTYIVTRAKELREAGIQSYSLNFDDAEGASSLEQKLRQVEVAHAVAGNVSDLALYYFTPSEYFQAHDGAGTTMEQWAQSLQTADSGLSVATALVVTGAVITPSTMSPSQFPQLASSRKKIFWDNWAAVDTSTRIPWGLVSGRVDPQIFAPSSASYGYVLNLNYPLERSIHHISCVGALSQNSTASCCAASVASPWATWLIDHGYGRAHSHSDIAQALQTAIQNDITYNSIAELEAAHPALLGVFSQPADLPPTSEPPSNSPQTPPAPESPQTPPASGSPAPQTETPTPTAPSSDYTTSMHLPFALVAFFTLIVAVCM